jgi:ribonuclease T2
LKTSLAFLLSLALLASTGCHGAPATHAAAHDAQPSPDGHLKGRAHIGAQPGYFDYYVFSLSWSPEFCETHPGNHVCASRPGFIVHGLWPQNNDGTYPENCDNAARPSIPEAYLNLIPTVSLLEHEWIAHGTCSGLNPDAYFSSVRTALQSIEIPSTFARSRTPPAQVAPEIILGQFRADNPSFPHSSFVLSCDNNQLTAIEACFDKNLNPIACQGLQSCRARTIKITPP